MKAITSHRLRNGFSLFLTISMCTILIVFANDFIKAFTSTSTKTSPTMVIIFLIGSLISVGVMIYM